MPRNCTVCGMTLSVLPAWNMQIDTTADFSGSTLRDTIDWMLLMICAPTSTVSMPRCGRAAWPPTPSMSMVIVIGRRHHRARRGCRIAPTGMPG